jgi:hypothetical protein
MDANSFSFTWEVRQEIHKTHCGFPLLTQNIVSYSLIALITEALINSVLPLFGLYIIFVLAYL